MKRLLPAAVLGLLIATALPASARKWTSDDGRFTTEAKLLGYADGKVKLKKDSGETVTISIERLSEADRRYVVLVSRSRKRIAAKMDTASNVSFAMDVQAFLGNYCMKCHNPQEPKGGYDVTTYAALKRAGNKGALIVAGKPAESRLILALQGEGEIMPPAGSAQPTEEEIAKVSAWITAGAQDDSLGPGPQPPPVAKPRK
ncbi:MAG: c-type cytochrome [Rhodopirellula sp.]|nr:c-type cytochrome [Rhodopirellula sp.]